MKKLVSLILLFALALSLLAGCGDTAGADTPDNTTDPAVDINQPQQDKEPEYQIMAPVEIPEEGITVNGEYYSKEALALIAVGDAYVNRGAWIQYDDSRLVAGSAAPSPIYRWSHGNNGVQDPENSSEAHTLYTNCAAFIHTLYKEAFGFDLGSWTTAQFIERTDMIVYKYNVQSDEDSLTRQAICNQVWETLQPGDLIVYRYNGEANGHIMAYVGNDTLVHSTAPGGGSYDYTTPKEKAEATGSIQYMSVTSLFRESYSRYLFGLSRFAVLRPLEAFKDQIEITDETLNRMQYMSGVIAQLYSTHPYGNSANQGDEITYTVKIENTNSLAVQCTLSLKPDENAQYISGADSFDGTQALWEFVIAPNTTVEINYTLKVKDKTETYVPITCGEVLLNGVQLKCPDVVTNHTLTRDEQAAVAQTARGFVGKKSDPMELVNSIYTQALGVSPQLGSEKQVFDGVFSYYNNTTTHLNVLPYGQYFELVVDAVYGGRYVVNNNLLTKRTSVVRPNMLIVGDILIAAADVKAANCTVYMMLDSGCLMELDNSGGAKILSAAESADVLMKVLAKHAFVLLRPSYGM